MRIFPVSLRAKGALFAFLPLCAAVFGVRGAAELPAASNVVQRVVERSQSLAAARQTNHYAYDKRSVTVELDDHDAAIKSTEKLYRVVLIGGLPFSRLVKIQGRELTPKELERENRREAAFRKRVTHVDLNQKAGKKEGLATQDLVDRFDFKMERRETVEGRPTLVVSFAPKPDAKEKTMEDKVYKRVFGTVWVDEEEAEIARLDASVRGPVSLGWFGAVGSLNSFQALLNRSRLPDGIWVNRKSTFSLAARKLFTAIRFRTTEESSGFHLE